MGQNYPDTQGFAYSFSRGEITLKSRIYSAINSVSFTQTTEEGVVKGTSPFPLARTVGTMGLGEGTITFSDDRERIDFLNDLGEAYREQIFGVSYVMRGSAGDEKKVALIGVRVLDNPIEHEEGADALGGDVAISFMDHTIDGKRAHSK